MRKEEEEQQQQPGCSCLDIHEFVHGSFAAHGNSELMSLGGSSWVRRHRCLLLVVARVLLFLWVFLFFCCSGDAVAAAPTTTGGGGGGGGDLEDQLYDELNALTMNLTAVLLQQFSFCIAKRESERDEIFGFKQNSAYLSDCDNALGGSASNLLCGTEEMKLYFTNLATVDTTPPNVNCNSSNWSLLCEPGWAAPRAIGIQAANNSQRSHDNVIPLRNNKYPQPCCAGFFCPQALACMIPCPLGAYCPLATLNNSTGDCDPYGYQITQANDSCGGADKWADVSSTINIFCPAGQYCPTPVEARNCSTEHFCRLGSTVEESCSQLTSCKSQNLKSQNLQGVGGLILAILSVLLLVVYTCSDWLMDIRKRQKSAAREVAAKQAKERVSMLERWRKARGSAKLQASRLSRKVSRSISRKLDSPNTQQQMTEEDSEVREQGDASDSYGPSPLQPTTISPSPGETSTPLTTNCPHHHQHHHPPPHQLLPIPRKGSHSQMFAYAYGQIEKERVFGLKGQSPSVKDLEPSLLPPKTTAATSSEQQQYYDDDAMVVVEKKRFKISLSFIDLSLVLKGSGKKILSNVTGKLAPGCITAVMGPSGAGKTMFLNALAGKSASFSHTTGQVFINGHPGSIHCYKRIIGFVPQDDVVHGSLTVEENLWFSANYRLPVKMQKYERVLVVERIIQALGLGYIRDSVVGTVENRGISGGQRKRVNVGLEMVMEPSLLILDEPTSGLDSTSSRLVLQALRREALVGVNVVLVVHQPSYGLFRMFDDVMFLAKGGYTVYLGPVNEAEAYFAGLGLVVPDRINPPDHYMDALEGIVDQPQNASNFDPKALPVLWMMHKGYNVPSELLVMRAMDISSATCEDDDDHQEMKNNNAKNHILLESSKLATSFAQEVWADLCHHFVVIWDGISSTFSKVEDKAGRETPGFLLQFQIVFIRVAKQRFREVRVHVQDYIILLIAGACLGFLSNMKDANLGSQGYIFTITAIALLSMIAALRTFSVDKLQFWRESASGINRTAFFLAKDVVDLFNVGLKPLIYLSMFYFLSTPRSTFLDNYIVTLVLVYCVTGISYIIAILFEPVPAQLWSVFLPILATLIVTSKHTGFLLQLSYLSYARYALEAYVIANAKMYKGVWLITRCGVLANQGYSVNDWGKCILVLFLYGIVARLVALLCLLFSHRRRQK
ncbi:unnamed protein product [Sphagnum tenellum]